jgi:hypothetical protein
MLVRRRPARKHPARVDVPAESRAISSAARPTYHLAMTGSGSSFRATVLIVFGYAVAMAYIESAVVVYLNGALGTATGDIFPLRTPDSVGVYAAIEVGREVATLAMLTAIGWLAGRSGLERLGWSAVAFGVWDIAYYGWLWVFAGWPSSPGTFDLLFLIPVPWVGPVWAPIVVSLALVGYGLEAGRASRNGRRLAVTRAEAASAVAGGAMVVLGFTLQAGRVMAGGIPVDFAWPVFATGMVLAAVPATRVVRRASTTAPVVDQR